MNANRHRSGRNLHQGGRGGRTGKILVKGSRPTGAQRGHEATIRDMAVCRLNSWRKCGLTLSDIDAIGIGIPGVITTTA